MRIPCTLILVLILFVHGLAQKTPMYKTNADSTAFTLTTAGASHLASLPLKCLFQEYPNKTGHIALSDSDGVLRPKQLHPAFYGCFDWHSCVHGHWMLVRLLKEFPSLPESARIRSAISKNITVENIRQEIKYFGLPLASSYERTYGWAWLLRLQQELITWKDPDADTWKQALQPLCDSVVQWWMKFLPKQTYANRTGVHPNTAFGLAFALDYARTVHQKAFEEAIVRSARQLYLHDRKAPALWEPDGTDFFSPSLEEADLMRRVLTNAQFLQWFNGYFTPAALQHLTVLPVVSDRTDLSIVHLDGLCFTRSWCMRGIAAELPASDKRRILLIRAAVRHLNASLPHVASGSYGGEHWLASFAVYALTQQ